MSSADPFSSRFEVFGREPKFVVSEVNRAAYDRLLQLLALEDQEDGRVILLRAPRAGFGKTFLLQRISSALKDSHQFIRINLIGGRTTDAAHVLEYLLQALCKALPGSTTLTQLDYLARKILALGLEPMVSTGEVPCQDRDGALKALQEQPIETFDFHHDRAVTAHWTKSNFEILGPRLASEVSQLSGASLRESSYWVELLFRFATTAPDNVERTRLLFETVFRGDLQNMSESAAEERLNGLLALLGVVTRVVFIVDDTEGLSSHPPDALELGSFLTTLAQNCPGTLVVLSVNGDVWETAFLPCLPGGLADRLTEYQVTLDGLSEEQAEALVRERAGAKADEVLNRLSWGEDLYPRMVLKSASEAWAELGLAPLLVAEEEEVTTPESKEGSDDDDDLPGLEDIEAELAGTSDLEPIETKSDLSPAFASAALTPLSESLLKDTEDTDEEQLPPFAPPTDESKVEEDTLQQGSFEAEAERVPTPEDRDSLNAPQETEDDPALEAAASLSSEEETSQVPLGAEETSSPFAALESTLSDEPANDQETTEPEDSPFAAGFPPNSPFAAVGEDSTDAESAADTTDGSLGTASPFAPVGEKPAEDKPAFGAESTTPTADTDDAPSPFAPVGEKPEKDEPAPESTTPTADTDDAPSPFAAMGEKSEKDEPAFSAESSTPTADTDEAPSPFAAMGEKPEKDEPAFRAEPPTPTDDTDEAPSPFAPVGEKPEKDKPAFIAKSSVSTNDADEAESPFAAVEKKIPEEATPAFGANANGTSSETASPAKHSPFAAMGESAKADAPLAADEAQDAVSADPTLSPFSPTADQKSDEESARSTDKPVNLAPAVDLGPFGAFSPPEPSSETSEEPPGGAADSIFAPLSPDPEPERKSDSVPGSSNALAEIERAIAEAEREAGIESKKAFDQSAPEIPAEATAAEARDEPEPSATSEEPIQPFGEQDLAATKPPTQFGRGNNPFAPAPSQTAENPEADPFAPSPPALPESEPESAPANANAAPGGFEAVGDSPFSASAPRAEESAEEAPASATPPPIDPASGIRSIKPEDQEFLRERYSDLAPPISEPTIGPYETPTDGVPPLEPASESPPPASSGEPPSPFSVPPTVPTNLPQPAAPGDSPFRAVSDPGQGSGQPANFSPPGQRVELPPRKTPGGFAPNQPASSASPFEAATPPAFGAPESGNSPAVGPPPLQPVPSKSVATPQATGPTKPTPTSPFAPVDSAPPESAIDPSTGPANFPVETPVANDADDKVDELLRQFKERYGRD